MSTSGLRVDSARAVAVGEDMVLEFMRRQNMKARVISNTVQPATLTSDGWLRVGFVVLLNRVRQPKCAPDWRVVYVDAQYPVEVNPQTSDVRLGHGVALSR